MRAQLADDHDAESADAQVGSPPGRRGRRLRSRVEGRAVVLGRLEELGRLDALVNNVGTNVRKAATEYTTESGHGDTTTDSHTGVPHIDHTRAEWERLDLPPFRAAIGGR